MERAGGLTKRRSDLAAEMFMKGLDALQPCINEELICEYEGKKIDIGNELYASMKGVFNGISIVPSVSSVKGRAFQGISEPVIIRVSPGKCTFTEFEIGV